MTEGTRVEPPCDEDKGDDGDEVGPRNDDVSDVPGRLGLAACSGRAVVEWLRCSQNGLAGDGDSPLCSPDSLTCEAGMAIRDESIAVKKRDQVDKRVCEVVSS